MEIIYISPNHEINFKALKDVELQRKSLNFSRKEIIFSECFTKLKITTFHCISKHLYFSFTSKTYNTFEITLQKIWQFFSTKTKSNQHEFLILILSFKYFHYYNKSFFLSSCNFSLSTSIHYPANR